MTVAATAKRRRRQAKMGFTNLAPQQRPHYKMADSATAQRRLEQTVARENERRMRQKKAKK